VTGVGPFPIHAVMAAAATGVGWLVVRTLARRLPEGPGEHLHRVAGALFVDAVFVGIAAARLGYVLRWWPEYTTAPISIVAIGDGGFLWWSGLPAAVAFAWWRTSRRLRLRRPLLAGMAAGMLAWTAFGGMLLMLQRSAPPLPGFELASLEGKPTTLAALSGRPIVLNLWATWCPPCRREMPVLEEAQGRYPGVSFVLVNQGEDRITIREYLDGQGLVLDHVLLDPHSRAMLETNTRGLPTTLFFDAGGRLVDTHMGELTRASLADTLRRRFGVAVAGDATVAADGG
jgi:thiol-disulfide isomerase/thioredoxin